MKKTISAAIGGRNFILDEDAYYTLDSYLKDFRAGIGNQGGYGSSPEVMEEVEMRIADLFKEELKGRDVVDMRIVNKITAQLGMPDNSGSACYEGSEDDNGKWPKEETVTRKFYRDLDHNMIGGVCSGLSIWMNIDVVILRVIFTIALFLGTAGFWIYIVFCLIAPAARTAVQKCELHGVPATAENIRRFSDNRK